MQFLRRNKGVVEQICKLAKKGLPPSTIGRQLRDSNGIGSIRAVTGVMMIDAMSSELLF